MLDSTPALDGEPTVRGTQIDVAHAVEEYLGGADWRIKANANQGYSLGGLILNVSGKVIANYWLDQVYPAAIGRAHREADIHVHDLDMLSGYCAGWSLRTLLNEGLNGVSEKAEAGPPRHFSVALGQAVNFLGALQNEWAGAQAFSSFDTYMAPFVRVDGLDYDAVRQGLQEFVHSLNVPSRWGTQTPFTNLTFDWVCPEDLREQTPLIGGEEADFTYGDLQAEMDLINRAFIDVMTAGDAKGRVFTFPIPTYNITKDINLDLSVDMRGNWQEKDLAGGQCLGEGHHVPRSQPMERSCHFRLSRIGECGRHLGVEGGQRCVRKQCDVLCHLRSTRHG